MQIELAGLEPIESLARRRGREAERLQAMGREAAAYISAFAWCRSIVAMWYGFGVGDVVAVFLVHIEPSKPEVDNWLWVIVGDVPPAYLVTDRAPTPGCALEGYTELMSDWIHAVRNNEPTDACIPVNAPPTIEWANALDSRVTFIREHILPLRADELTRCDDDAT